MLVTEVKDITHDDRPLWVIVGKIEFERIRGIAMRMSANERSTYGS